MKEEGRERGRGREIIIFSSVSRTGNGEGKDLTLPSLFIFPADQREQMKGSIT